MRKLLAVSFTLAFVSATAVLLFLSSRPETLPVGSPVPAVEVELPDRTEVLGPADRSLLVVMLFHSDCEACLDELRMLESEIERLEESRLVMLTDEPTLDLERFPARWPRLAGSPSVSWGRISAHDFRETFGGWATPAIYVFDAQGRLSRKFVGQKTPTTILGAADLASAPGSSASP